MKQILTKEQFENSKDFIFYWGMKGDGYQKWLDYEIEQFDSIDKAMRGAKEMGYLIFGEEVKNEIPNPSTMYDDYDDSKIIYDALPYNKENLEKVKKLIEDSKSIKVIPERKGFIYYWGVVWDIKGDSYEEKWLDYEIEQFDSIDKAMKGAKEMGYLIFGEEVKNQIPNPSTMYDDYEDEKWKIMYNALPYNKENLEKVKKLIKDSKKPENIYWYK